jgi:hypothetical protein
VLLIGFCTGFTGCGKTPCPGRYGLQPIQPSIRALGL